MRTDKMTVILGLGNPILTDDGVGIYVARKLDDILRATNHESRVTIKEASLGGFNFIDLLAGYDRAAIIDAIHTKNGKPGEFYELDTNALKPSYRISSLHQIDLPTACILAEKMKIHFPKEIAIFVMEVKDEFSFGEKPTQEIKEAIPRMAKFIFENLSRRGWIKPN